MANEIWETAKGQVWSDPILDPGTGRPMFIRQFFFKYHKPTHEKIKAKQIPEPTNQQLFDQAWRVIRPLLWGDGLIANEDIEPKIVRGKEGYIIILTCEPRLGQVVTDRISNLTRLLNDKPKSFTKK